MQVPQKWSEKKTEQRIAVRSKHTKPRETSVLS